MSRDTADLLDLMNSRIEVELLLSRDAYLKPTYAAKTPYKGKVSYQTHLIRGPNGENVTADGIIWLACEKPIPTTARVTLPDGSQPTILKSGAPCDETGVVMYVRLDFG